MSIPVPRTSSAAPRPRRPTARGRGGPCCRAFQPRVAGPLLALTWMLLGPAVALADPPSGPHAKASDDAASAAVAEERAPRRQVALTFDDLPAVPMRSLADARRITDDLLAGLARHQIPAMGLVNEGKLVHPDEYPGRLDLLRRWLADGHLLGNHTANHPSIDAVGADAFQADVLAGEPALRELLAERRQSLRYFRHPYLQTGRRAEERRQVDRFLAERGYTIVPVTLENNDWLFNAVYVRALREGDPATAERVAEAYLDHTDQLLGFLESVARRFFEREIPHILLLHANWLNTDHLDGLVGRLRARGYDFVDVPTALEDPAYGSADTFVGPQGAHWLYRWVVSADPAVAEGYSWTEEPQPTEWVAERYRERR